MKAIYFLLGLLFGAGIVFTYACLKLDRPTCYEDQFLIRDYTGQYVCINVNDIKPLNE